MRKIIFSLLIFTCYLLPAQTGVIRELTGTVEISAAGGAFVPAAIGAVLAQNAVISTGFRSSALIEVGSTFLAVRPLSRMTLTEISSMAGTETLGVNLQAGRVRVEINPPPGTRSSMEIISPMAVASVRGTSFDFDTRNLYVHSGNVIFKGTRSQGTPIGAGSSSSIGTKGIAINPVAIGPAMFLRPQLPSGTQAHSSPAPITVFRSDSPPPAPGPDRPNTPSNPGGGSGSPGAPGGGDDTGAGIGIIFN
ncbi:MAG: FecR family protein [Treponema sp.]|nr:FecR family protein [Treponema sp.]